MTPPAPVAMSVKNWGMPEESTRAARSATAVGTRASCQPGGARNCSRSTPTAGCAYAWRVLLLLLGGERAGWARGGGVRGHRQQPALLHQRGLSTRRRLA